MNHWLLIAGMFVVTYLPRVVPFLLGREIELPLWVRRWLDCFPYAALGALIFPGILQAVPGRPWLSLGAGAVAAAAALILRHPFFAVLSSITFLLAVQSLPGL